MAEVFKVMPDSLMPYLSTNNRLDMIDFMEAKMKAEVTNLLDGTTEMTALSDDSLSITMNERLRVDMRLTVRDSLVVEMTKTYTISEHQVEKVVQYYSTTWCPLSDLVSVSSTLLRRDEEVAEKPHF
ncbi:MAG: DUF3256 family protein [Prevotella sp.]|nr:DUF3256 family protein [Prevotella sp.]